MRVGTCNVFLALVGKGVGALVVGRGGAGSKGVVMRSEVERLGEEVVLVSGVGIGDLAAGNLLRRFKGESLARFLIPDGERTCTLATNIRERHLRNVK